MERLILQVYTLQTLILRFKIHCDYKYILKFSIKLIKSLEFAYQDKPLEIFKTTNIIQELKI